MEAQSDKLLHDLVEHEKALVSRVEEARREAAEIIAKAQREAARIVADAEAEAERRAQARLDQTRAEADAAHQAVVEATGSEVAETRARMDANVEAAVRLVMERVVP